MLLGSAPQFVPLSSSEGKHRLDQEPVWTLIKLPGSDKVWLHHC